MNPAKNEGTARFRELMNSTIAPAASAHREVARRHFNGEARVDLMELTTVIRGEALTATSRRGICVDFASAFVEGMADDFEVKLKKLWKRGAHSVLFVGTPRSAYDRSKYALRAIDEIRKKLPRVVEKVKGGDLNLFVNLLGTQHVYGQCIGCGFIGAFNLGASSRGVQTFDTALAVGSDAYEYAGSLIAGHNSPPDWKRVASYCAREGCTHACAVCGTNTPLVFDQRWVEALRADRMCPMCALKQLVNCPRPELRRADYRRFRKFSM